MGHRAAVNVVDFDEKYIVSASGDRTIKVNGWSCIECVHVRVCEVLLSTTVMQGMFRSLCLFVCAHYVQVWRTSTSEFVRTLHGHRRGIACLQYRGNHVVSGSSDNTIRYTWR